MSRGKEEESEYRSRMHEVGDTGSGRVEEEASKGGGVKEERSGLALNGGDEESRARLTLEFTLSHGE